MLLRLVTEHVRSLNWTAVGIGLLIAVLACGPATASTEAWTVRSDWARYFAEAGVGGTLVVVDERTNPASRWVHDEGRARTRFIPASTFKIAHALFALDAGIVRDEFQVFRWDGTRREIDSWNRDQDLRSSMRNSAVWVYQAIAREIGEDGERRYLQRIGYGNADPSGDVDRFWLAGRDWILRAKTGWKGRRQPQVGWWVGWVEWPEGPVFFALNIEMLNEGADLPKREAIARAVLRSIGALPPEQARQAEGQPPK